LHRRTDASTFGPHVARPVFVFTPSRSSSTAIALNARPSSARRRGPAPLRVEGLASAPVIRLSEDRVEHERAPGSSRYHFPVTLTVELERAKSGEWIAEIPELPGCMVVERSERQALARVEALAFRVLADRLEHGEAQAKAMARVARHTGLRPEDL